MNLTTAYNKTFTILEGANIATTNKDCLKDFYAPSVREKVLQLLKGKDETGIGETFNFLDNTNNGYSLIEVGNILGVSENDNTGGAKLETTLQEDIRKVVCRWEKEQNVNYKYKDCFGDCFVGLKYSCNYDQPTSGIYVNSLPSVSFKKFDVTADEETRRGENLFKQLHDESIEKVIFDVESRLSKDYSFNRIIEQKKIGRIGKTFSGSDTLKGFTVDRHVGDSYQLSAIESISFKSDAYVNAMLYIDADEGTWSKPIEVKKGRNDIIVNFETQQDEVKFWIDGCFKIADETQSCGCGTLDCLTCSTTCGCFNVRFFEIDNNDITYTGNNGIKINAVCKSTIKPLICQNVDDFKFPAQYKIGISLMKEVEVSSNTHPLCRNSKEDAKKLLKRWEGVKNEFTGEKIDGEYWKYIYAVVKKFKMYLEGVSSVASAEGDTIYVEVTP